MYYINYYQNECPFETGCFNTLSDFSPIAPAGAKTMTNETLDLLELVAKSFLDGIQKYRANGLFTSDSIEGKSVMDNAKTALNGKSKKRGALKMMVALLKEAQKPLSKKQLHNAIETKFATIVSNGAISQAINTGLKNKVLQRTGRATYALAAAEK